MTTIHKKASWHIMGPKPNLLYSLTRRWKHYSLILFLSSINVFFTTTTTIPVSLPSNTTFPALIVFGDSYADTGNNNYLNTIAKCNYAPYGINFEGGIPTGRFGDGEVFPDLVAEGLGIKRTIPASLDPTLTTQDLLTGVSFASGGSGFNPSISRSRSALSMTDQLKNLEEYIEKLKKIGGEETTDYIISKSLFLVVAGSNDVPSITAGNFQFDVPSYTSSIIKLASDFMKKLYGYGGRRILVVGVPPFGCLPSQRTLGGGLQRDCDQDYNDGSKLFNSKLSSMLESLSETLQDAKFVYFDYYYSLLELIETPQKYGFEVADKGCCGTGLIETIWLCNKFTASVCPNISAYLFWDGYHPTGRANRILISKLLDKSIPMFFV